MPAAGGAERQLTHLDAARHEVLHIDPVELPGGRRILFTSVSSEGSRVEAVTVGDGGARTVVVERASSPAWLATGHLLFERDGTVWAAPFDLASCRTSGAAVPVVRAGEFGVLRFGSLGYRLSTTGTLVYMPPEYDHKRVVSVSRDGVERALELPPGPYANPRVSPDGKRLLVERNSSVTEVLELSRGTRTQLAAPAFGTLFSTWTRDGDRVVSRRLNLPHWVAADGSGRSARIPGGTVNDYPAAAGPDNESVFIVRIQAQSAGDILLVQLGGATAPRPLIATPAYEGGPQLSPDGRWLAYQTNASGRPEILVRSYPALDRAWQVSEGGGVQTRWSTDGREIYYRSGQRVMAAAFDGSAAEPALGRPVALFADEYDFGQGLSIANYDVTRDGRFVMLRRTPSGGRLRVVLNWTGEMERLLASGGVR